MKEENKCVYLIRYNKWDANTWKIGRTKLLDSRLTNYKTHNIFLPDIVFVKSTNDYDKEEKLYHKKYELKKVSKTNEFFHLTISDIEFLQLDGFVLHGGNYDIITLDEKCDTLVQNLQEKIIKIKEKFAFKLDNLCNEYKDFLKNTRIEYEEKQMKVIADNEIQKEKFIKYKDNEIKTDENYAFIEKYISKQESEFILWTDLWKIYQDWYFELHGNNTNLKKLETKKYLIEKIFKIEDKMIYSKGRGWLNYVIRKLE